MSYCPSHDWDEHCRREDEAAVEAWKQSCKPKPGLYSKFVVQKTRCDENGDVYLEPVEAGSFVLVPFHSDGSVRDPAAVAALEAYRDACRWDALKADINAWIASPTSYDWVNQPTP